MEERAGHNRQRFRTIFTITVTALSLAASLPAEAASRRGPFAFHYGPVLSEDQLAWYSQFDLLVTHDPLPPVQVRRLRDAGTRLLIYEWAVAFYETRANRWQRSLLATKKALLNDQALTGGVGSESAGAWYFDPATPEHESGRAADLARFVRTIGYEGVFLDTTTVESVHPEARKEFARRHPDASYDEAYSRFLIQLRREMPDGVIFTNQGYRSAEQYLPYVDWDLTESLITRPGKQGPKLRPWDDPADHWNSIRFVMRTVIAPLIARYPGVRLGQLNYSDGHDYEAIRLVVAIAQLFGTEGYVAGPSVVAEADPIYFRDPGRPLSPLIESDEGCITYRFFEHGLIAISASAREASVQNRGRTSLRNRDTGELVCGDTITIPPGGAGARAFFFDTIPDGDSPGE